MNRFLGSSKGPKAPAPTMADQQGLQQKWIDDLQKRVTTIEQQLIPLRQQLKKARAGSSQHASVKRRTMPTALFVAHGVVVLYTNRYH